MLQLRAGLNRAQRFPNCPGSAGLLQQSTTVGLRAQMLEVIGVHSSKLAANSGPDVMKFVVFANTVFSSVSLSLTMFTPCVGKRNSRLRTSLEFPVPGRLVWNCG